MHIIPAVDIRGGRAVRLLRGEKRQETVYFDSPLDAARNWAEQGATRLHVVDLDGAFDGRSGNETIIADIIEQVPVPVQVGGGIRTLEKAGRLVEMGAAQVIVGTRALESRVFLEELVRTLPGKVSVGVDARDGMVAVKGWTSTSKVRADDFLRSLDGMQVATVIYTDISRDGALTGPNLAALRRALAVTSLPLIASGGVSCLRDLETLRTLPLFGIISGKALYEGRFTLAQALATVAA